MAKRLVILGGGERGIGAAILAKQKGYDVFVSDRKFVKRELYVTSLNRTGYSV